jgi:hypothetical protein
MRSNQFCLPRLLTKNHGLSVPLHNGTLQTGHVTKRYVLQNGTRYKTVRVTKRYVLQNGTRYKTVTLQNVTCYTTVRYETVTVTERYVYKTVHVTERYFLYCAMKAPTHGLVGHLP